MRHCFTEQGTLINKTTMHQPNTPSDRYFLNRLAMEAQGDPTEINPFCKLRHVFEYATVHEMWQQLNLICSAAMNEEYVWETGSPGNCLYYFSRLELLIECCYLVKIKTLPKTFKGRKNPLPKKLPVKMLPIPLTGSEFRHPLRIIESFFQYASIQEWKRQLLIWVENALSRSSVKDELPPETLLPFAKHLHKLVYAAYLLCEFMYHAKET